MFEINNEKMSEKKAEIEAHEMLSKIISEMILKSNSAPESVKLCVMLLDSCKSLCDEITNLSRFCAFRKVKTFSDRDCETLKKTIEYVKLVETGVLQYKEQISIDADVDERTDDL